MIMPNILLSLMRVLWFIDFSWASTAANVNILHLTVLWNALRLLAAGAVVLNDVRNQGSCYLLLKGIIKHTLPFIFLGVLILKDNLQLFLIFITMPLAINFSEFYKSPTLETIEVWCQRYLHSSNYRKVFLIPR